MQEGLVSATIQNELVQLPSFTDPLTEIYNRRSLDDMATRYIGQARHSHKPLTFLLVDVDRFKQVNTRFGHLTGDFVLAEIAALLKTSVRGSDAVVRYGGDEFLIILADTSGDDAGRVVHRAKTYLHEWNRAGHLDDFEITLSIGISEWSDGETLDEILDAATAKCTPRKRRRVKRRFQATTIPHAERFFRTTGKIWCVLECTLTAFIDAPCIGIGQDPLILGWLDLDVWMAHRWATSGTSVLFTS